MSTDELTVLEAEENEPDGQKTPKSGLMAGIAVLLAIGALALSGLVWLEKWDTQPQQDSRMAATIEQLRQSQAAQSQELASLDSRINQIPTDTASEDITSLESALSDAVAQMRSLRGDLETQQSYTQTLQQAIESLQARLMAAETSLAAQAPSRSSSPDQFNLAGVDYLLRLAPERLSLFHDVSAADDALASADAQLAAMDNPVYLGLRQHIAEARQLLADTDLPNPIEISADLDSVQQQLAALTFGGESAAQNIEASGAEGQPESGWWQRLKSSLASLVTVRRSASDAESRLTIEDKDLLRQGLWMQVEGARLALMRHDQASWEDTLSRAQGALNQWFDPSSDEFKAVSGQLQALSGINVVPELPDISGPWAQLQLIRQANPTPAAPAAESVAEPASEMDLEPAEEPASEPATKQTVVTEKPRLDEPNNPEATTEEAAQDVAQSDEAEEEEAE